jgi:diguanylate cyclase (GGDEF)-like protein
VPRRVAYALDGAILALGAPLGLGIVRSLASRAPFPSWLWRDFGNEAWTYGYVALSTMVAFSAFGFALGRQADRLSELSETDPLTGLRNRRRFQRRLEKEFERAKRYGIPLSLLLIDVDGLKDVNDRYGHRAGDAALRKAAEAIRETARNTDIGARWGGDEFALLAPSTERDDAVRLAERVRNITALGLPQGGLPATTVSVGLATFDPERPLAAAEDLVRAADVALYLAKTSGRNRVTAGGTPVPGR